MIKARLVVWVAAAVVVACALWPTVVRAEACNKFETLQAIMLYEARDQSIDAKTLIGYGALNHGICDIDDNYYTQFRTYLGKHCETLECGVRYYLYSFPASLRENAARAAYQVLTDPNIIVIRHFDAAGSRAWFFNDVRACPVVYGYAGDSEGRLIDVLWFEVDNTRFC